LIVTPPPELFVIHLDAVSQTLAIVVVGVGDGNGLDALFHQHFGNNLTLTGVRRGGAEEQTESSKVDSAGDVADGEIIATPLAMATFCRVAMVTPEQSAPMMPLTPSDVIRRSAVAVAAAASTQVESPRTRSHRDTTHKRT
jgi:hypothetical protein